MTTRPAAPPLHARAWPSDGLAPPLVLLHGFTQNSDCWGVFGEQLAATHPVIAVDAPGHGRSRHDGADLWRTADLVATTIELVAPEAPVVVGYSMGGRTALHLALRHPGAVRGLVLIGATAGIDDEEERAARRVADEALATRLETEPLADFIDRWLANPLFAGLDPEAAARTARLANRREGLAASLRHCGTGTQEPLWERLGTLDLPVLLLAGRRDHKFTTLADRLAGAMTASQVSVALIDGTHAVHLERPVETSAVIGDWLSERFAGRRPDPTV